MDFGGLLDAVGVEEGAGEVDDGLAAPGHHEAAGVGDGSDMGAFEVFLVGCGNEIGNFRRIDADGHAFLGLGDGEFGAVETIVFFGDGIQVDFEGRGDLADGDGDAAGTEVVANLDFAGEFRVAEEALDFPFRGGVAFLDFGGVFEGSVGVFFGRASGAADAIAAGATADEKDDIAGRGRAAKDLGTRGGGDNRADFQAFGDIAGVIDFRDLAGGEADLVAVGRIAVGGDLADFFLREFAGEGGGEWRARIAGAGDPHGLIDIRPSGQRIADAAAQAGGRAAERFDLGGVVVGFVLEHDQPLLRRGWMVDRGWWIVDGRGLNRQGAKVAKGRGGI